MPPHCEALPARSAACAPAILAKSKASATMRTICQGRTTLNEGLNEEREWSLDTRHFLFFLSSFFGNRLFVVLTSSPVIGSYSSLRPARHSACRPASTSELHQHVTHGGALAHEHLNALLRDLRQPQRITAVYEFTMAHAEPKPTKTLPKLKS
jgi:hypothetical protein